MNRLALMFVLVCAGAVCGAQTLQGELSKAGIPASGFNSAELAQTVNAASTRDGDSLYLAYMRVDANNMLTGSPQLVRFDAKSGALVRKELEAGEKENCCGSPLGIQFTAKYVLTSFHNTPSASTFLVTDKSLRLVEVLFGFDVHEIAPDVVVFTKNMIHFAPEHAERKQVIDLSSGSSQELYPPKGDALRAEFARIHEQHMPSPEACGEANDPCDPNIYDESLIYREGAKPGQFELVVSRTAEHDWVSKGEVQEWPVQIAVYTYARGKRGWLYCERDETAQRLNKSLEHAIPPEKDQGCEPNLPVVPDSSSPKGPFPGVIRMVK